ncbi:hypothetical protein ABZ949_01845 [Micromonospora tulbaghiae]|uniref:hypothetical protein n=1 Tax=Micromonospora tulbaghiae TaxID=479978 RepID=UPI0033EC6E9E
MSETASALPAADDPHREAAATPTDSTTRDHIYAWAKAIGLDNWLTTADYDDLARRLAPDEVTR